MDHLTSMGVGFMTVGTSAVAEDQVNSVRGTASGRASEQLRRSPELVRKVKTSLKAGDERHWICGACNHSNSYPSTWLPQDAATRQYPFPSQGYFRKKSRELITEHGPLVRLTDHGSATAVRWRLLYKDGTQLMAGHPGIAKMNLDINFFPGDTGREGRAFAVAFFKESGFDVSTYDVFELSQKSSLELRDGKTFEVPAKRSP